MSATAPQLSQIAAVAAARSPFEADSDSCAFKAAQWSQDGTCILTNSGHTRGQLDTFIVPHDLLENNQSHLLQPYATLKCAEPVYAYAPSPFFNLSDASSTLILSCSKDHPIQLHNALAYANGAVATYPLTSEKEDHITPSSLAFARSGAYFVAGSDRYLSVFDVSRNGSPPLEMHRTIPSRKAMKKVGGTGISGVVSSLDTSQDALLAAGTFNRAIGIYSNEGRGECVSMFKLDEAYTLGGKRLHGTGVTKIRWSPCGRYLYAAERKSNLIFAYDIRGAGMLLATLVGRRGDTNQRLDFDIVPCDNGQGHELWAGGTDGGVRIWRNPHDQEGDVSHDWELMAHSDPVVSSAVHPSGVVLATCSSPDRNGPGDFRRYHPHISADIETEPMSMKEDGIENSREAHLKLWSIT